MSVNGISMSNMSIKKKMYVLIVCVILALLAIGNAAVYGARALTEVLKVQDLVRQTESEVLMLRRYENEFIA